jgi:hypothetical protein
MSIKKKSLFDGTLPYLIKYMPENLRINYYDKVTDKQIITDYSPSHVYYHLGGR